MLRDKISVEEKDTINGLRCWTNTERSVTIRDLLPIDEWLAPWEDNKVAGRLDKVFGDNLILSKEIHIAPDADSELREKISELAIGSAISTIFQTLSNNVIMLPEEIANVTYNNEVDEAHLRYWKNGFIQPFFSTDNLISNRYQSYGRNFEIALPSGKTYKIVQGCKVMRALQFLCKEFGLSELFEPFRLRHSQLMNEQKTKTETLCLSIHPLDYLTASYNSNDWRSCMDWSDGEFRRGVVEMMTSPFVVVAYVPSHRETVTISAPHYNNEDYTTTYQYVEWNSKKWREFFIVTPDVISGIKGYPTWSRGYESEALKWLRELFAPVFSEVTFSNAITNYCFEGDNALPKDIDEDMHNAVINFQCGPAMYNDFYGENEYQMIFSTGAVDHFDNLSYNYSGPSICSVCGEAADYYGASFDCESSIACDNCLPVVRCICCGDTISEDYAYYLEGNAYCSGCFDSLPRCSCCGETIDPSNDIGKDFLIFTKNNKLLGRKHWWDNRYTPRDFYICDECEADTRLPKPTYFATDNNGHWRTPVVSLSEWLKQDAKGDDDKITIDDMIDGESIENGLAQLVEDVQVMNEINLKYNDQYVALSKV